MAAPWDKDPVVEEHADGPPVADTAEQAPWNNDRGVEGSGGYEDTAGDPGTEGEQDRTADGRLLVNIHGDADPYEVAQTPDNAGAAGARGVMDTVTMGGANRLFAGLEGAESALNGGSFFDTYDTRLKQFQDVMHADEANHPVARITGQLIGGLAIPAGLEGVGLRAGTSVLRVGGSIQEARAAAAVAVRNRMALMGGAGGATHGYLSSDDLGSLDAAGNALTEGALGAAGGMAFGAAGQALSPGRETARVARRALPVTDAQRVAGAADRLSNVLPDGENFDLLPADVGGPTVGRLTAGAAQAPLSAQPIVAAAQRVLQRGQQVARSAAEMSGAAPADAATAGEAARTGAQAYVTSSRNAGGALYDRAGALAGDAMIEPIGARATLDQQIARLEAVPGGGQGLQEARDLRASLAGRFSVQGIRDMRTEMFVDPSLRGSPMDRRMRQIVDAAATDVENGLRTQGRGDAADAFRQADDFWRQRLATIDDVIEPIIGNDASKGGEAISKALDTASKGDIVKAQRFLATLPPEQDAVVRSSFINRLGMATKGQQNEAGDAFSMSTFLSNWSQLTDRARGVLFNPEQRAALGDLATVANGVRNAQKYANHSNTAGGLIAQTLLTGGAGLGGVKTLGTSLIAQYGGGRLLASPRFARWLARAPRTQLSGPAYLDRLTRIARAEPAIANDLLGLQSRLSEALHPERAAAQKPEDQQ
jgi:hypothetical protein